MADIIPFPKPRVVNHIKVEKTVIQQGKATTIIISDDVAALPGMALPYPSTDAVDPKYLAALKKQKETNG